MRSAPPRARGRFLGLLRPEPQGPDYGPRPIEEAKTVPSTDAVGGSKVGQFWLVVSAGKDAGRQLVIPEGETLVGRGSSCDLRLEDPSVSRKHSLFIRRGSELFVRDLRSANGTVVAGERAVVERPIRPGDRVHLGKIIISICADLQVDVAVQQGVERFASAAPRAGNSEPDREHTASERRNLRTIGAIAVASLASAGVTAAAIIFYFEHRAPAAAPLPPPIAVVTAPAAPQLPTPKSLTPPPPPAPVVAAPQVKKAAAPAKPAAAPQPPPAELTKPSPQAQAALTSATQKYLKGDLTGAMAAVERAGNDKRAKEMGKKLERFRVAYNQGKGDLAVRDADSAAEAFQKALSIDETIAGGAGRYGADVRQQLAKLHYLLGLKARDAGKSDTARQQLEAALRNDPQHTGARRSLAALRGSR